MVILSGEYLCFDDVLLVPQYSDIESRKNVEIRTNIAGICLSVPIISANMDTITEEHMARAIHEAGGLGILHRYSDEKKLYEQIYYLEKHNIAIVPSLGVNEEDREKAENLFDTCGKVIDAVCLDVAHGDHRKVSEMVGVLKQNFQVKVIAGNVATYEGACRLADAGADVIKIGVGPGSLCTTRLITGHGIPQLSAIMEVANIKPKYLGIQLIADGGIRYSGDIVKALAAGADAVMIGRLLAGCWETPGKVVGGKKLYRGSASFSAQMDHDGFVHNGTPEGESTFVPAKGSVKDIIAGLAGGIRSGLSYSGALSIKDLQESAMFIKVSNNTILENGVRL